MGLKGHTTRDIFPDFRTYVFPPVSPLWFRPKEWGAGARWSDPGTITDANALFITNDVQIGDAVYTISPLAEATTVGMIGSETSLTTNFMPHQVHENLLYKVGHGIHHTIQTLAAIVGKRAVTHYSIHHAKLWTGAKMPHWATDETGEVYLIGHDTGKALWLDGEIELAVGFPDAPPDTPLEPLHIDNWEGRFPDTPRPDYPPGLEPGGHLRAALVNDHGSLLQAHNAKTKVLK